MVVKAGYKKTEIGIIPEDWEVKKSGEIISFVIDNRGKTPPIKNSGNPLIEVNAIYKQGKNPNYNLVSKFVDDKTYQNWFRDGHPKPGDILVVTVGSAGTTSYINESIGCIAQNIIGLRTFKQYSSEYFYYLTKTKLFKDKVNAVLMGGVQPSLKVPHINNFKFSFPPLPEQKAIAEVLSDTDELIQTLEKQIAKKNLIKQGAMQKLLTPKEGWEVRKLGEIVDILDNLRIPLNDKQRENMKGDIPYCGANGIVDYVDDFVIDDEIILMAEDGGYFDEFKTRPIAYRIKGKCWVNNHAHILKSKNNFNQDFIFYSIVNKNILDYINAGTRAKLNKGELIKIEIAVPLLIQEQTQIAIILSDMDSEIEILESKLSKYKKIKQGMMQELLTGKTRLL
jgi:type I restriction enzyme, S subunit